MRCLVTAFGTHAERGSTNPLTSASYASTKTYSTQIISPLFLPDLSSMFSTEFLLNNRYVKCVWILSLHVSIASYAVSLYRFQETVRLLGSSNVLGQLVNLTLQLFYTPDEEAVIFDCVRGFSEEICSERSITVRNIRQEGDAPFTQ